MPGREHHALRNFLLFITSFGVAWYLWKERERIREKMRSLHNETQEDEQIIDVSDSSNIFEVDASEPEIEPEEKLEPAFVSPPLAEETATDEEGETTAFTAAEPTEPDTVEEVAESSADAEELEDLTEEPVEQEPVEPTTAEDDGEAKSQTWVSAVNGECPPGYAIKARFATGHYHEPGDRGYDKILPDCCYSSIEDAEADGFTASRWS